MYHCLIPFDNKNLPNEKLVNPRSMSITPSQVSKLTAEGQATCMAALEGSLYYPNVSSDNMPLEYTRGVDLNDTWEASYWANKRVSEYLKTKDATTTTLTDE